MDKITYAVLKKMIDNLSGPEIKAAVLQYMADNPDEAAEIISATLESNDVLIL